MRLPLLVTALILSLSLAPALAHADDAPVPALRVVDVSRLSAGPAPFPFVWRPYRQVSLPPLDLHNGTTLAQHLASGTMQLSLPEFLRLVVENNLDLYGARYDYAIAEVDVLRATSGQAARGTSSSPLPAALFAGAIGAGVSSTAALSAGGTGGAAITTQGKLVTIGPRGIFDPTLSMNLSYDHVVSPLNTKKVAGVAAVTVPSTVLQTRYQQELPFGTSYSVTFNLQHQQSTQAGLLFNPALTSFWSLSVYQPLLNGAGHALTRRFVTIADNDRQIVREAFRTTLNNTLSSAANAYWDLIALRDNVRLAREAVSIAEQSVNDSRLRQELGVGTALDTWSAESQLASARVGLVSAMTAAEQQAVALKTLISRNNDPVLMASPIEPTTPLPDPADGDLPPLAERTAVALAKRASIRQAELSLKNQHIAEEYTRKNLLPTFSVYGSLNLYGLAPNTSAAARQLAQWAYPEYAVGFTWSLPMFNRAAQADDMRARLEVQEAEGALQRTKTQIRVQVASADVSVAQGRAQVLSAMQASRASARAFAGEQERMDEGISTPYRVMLAHRDLSAAQSAEIRARVNYAKALVAHDVAVGEFLDRYGIVSERAQQGDLWIDSRRP